MKRKVWSIGHKLSALSVLAVLSLLIVACQPKTVVVEKVVTQQVEKVVTQQVEKVVTQQVEKVVTATPAPVQAGANTGTVTILGAFRGAEETAFNSVIAAFEAQNPDINILYSGTAEFETLISVRVEAGDPPDVAAFPQPGAVAKLAREGKLVPLWPEAVAVYDANYPAYWKELSQVDGVPYAMFHRVNAKGWIWYNKKAWDQAGYKVPTTWAEVTALSEQMKSTGIAPWGDGISSGAATGWKGTDWIENFMLRTQPVSVYDEWTAGKLPFSSDQVKNAWSYLTAIWMDPTEVYGGPQTVAVTDYRDPATWLFDSPPKCWMHMQGSFVTNFFPQTVQDNLDQDVGVFMMPPIDESLPFTLEVGGDEYVVFVGKDRPEVRKFIEFLGTPEAGKPWAELGGALFPYKNQDLSWYPTELDRNMAKAIIDAKEARFDASDNMPSALNLAFWKGVTDWVSGNRTLDQALSDIDQALPAQ